VLQDLLRHPYRGRGLRQQHLRHQGCALALRHRHRPRPHPRLHPGPRLHAPARPFPKAQLPRSSPLTLPLPLHQPTLPPPPPPPPPPPSPGVQEYCNFFKSIEDAKALRRRVSECFERAALPATPDEERRKLLSFVVVGGGPTGVEVAAELHDMIYDDLKDLYPKVIKVRGGPAGGGVYLGG
jgi:hypothetical protein